MLLAVELAGERCEQQAVARVHHHAMGGLPDEFLAGEGMAAAGQLDGGCQAEVAVGAEHHHLGHQRFLEQHRLGERGPVDPGSGQQFDAAVDGPAKQFPGVGACLVEREGVHPERAVAVPAGIEKGSEDLALGLVHVAGPRGQVVPGGARLHPLAMPTALEWAQRRAVAGVVDLQSQLCALVLVVDGGEQRIQGASPVRGGSGGAGGTRVQQQGRRMLAAVVHRAGADGDQLLEARLAHHRGLVDVKPGAAHLGGEQFGSRAYVHQPSGAHVVGTALHRAAAEVGEEIAVVWFQHPGRERAHHDGQRAAASLAYRGG